MRSRHGFYRFLFDLGGPLTEISGYIWSEKHDLFISISRLFFLMVFAFESGCLGLKNQAFCKGGIAKVNFRSNWVSHDSRIHFVTILGGLGTNFPDFCCPGDWVVI